VSKNTESPVNIKSPFIGVKNVASAKIAVFKKQSK